MPSFTSGPRERPPTDDLYAVLGIAPDADDAAIRTAWRAQAKEHHPDIARDPSSETRMRRINLAWSWLGNAARRREYDRSRAGHPGAPLEPSGWRPGSRDDGAGLRQALTSRRSQMVLAATTLTIVLVIVAVVGLAGLNAPHAVPAPTAVAQATTYVFTFGPTPEPTAAPTESAAPTETAPTETGAPTESATETAPTETGAPTESASTTSSAPTESVAPDARTPEPGSPASAQTATPTLGAPPPFATPAPPVTARPLTMPASDAPSECRTSSPTALRLDADVDGDGILDSIFFLGPCPDLSRAGAPDRLLGPYVYASGGSATWHLLDGVGPLAAGWIANSGFVGQILPAPAGTTDLGVALLATGGHTSAVVVYRIAGGSVKELWDSFRDGLTWQDATFAYGPTPAGASPNEGAILEVETGAVGGRVRQLWRWAIAGDALTLQLRRTDPIP